jgi:replicative DNA helicase
MNIPNLNTYLEKDLKSELETPEQMERFKEALRCYAGDDKIESSKDIEARILGGERRPVYSTGIPDLDALLRGGVRGGQMIVVAAITKHGKTEFCIHLTKLMQELNPLWFSYEDGAEEIVERFIDSNVPVPLFYSPATLAQKSPKWIEQRIVEAMVKYDTKLIFIDNINYLAPRGQNTSQEISFITKELKDMATRWNVTIVLVAQLTKVAIDRHPDVNDIKESSSIAQDASTVILLWRQTERDNKKVYITNNVNIDVQAARRGKPGSFKMTYENGEYHLRNWSDAVDAFNNDTF